MVLAAFILVHEHVDAAARPYLAEALPFIALGLGLLMVSRVRYVHLSNTYLRGRRPFGQVVALVFLLAFFWWYKELTLAVVVCGYALSGPVTAVIGRFRRAQPQTSAATETAGDEPQASPTADSQQRSA